MKTFLLALMALTAMQLSVRSTVAAEIEDQQVLNEDQLIPADELATQDGLDLNALDSQSTEEALRRPRPPRPPYPPHYPPPPPHYPPPPPNYPPPPSYWYECAARSQYGQTFVQRGNNPSYLQRSVVDACERRTGTYCRALGCRRY